MEKKKKHKWSLFRCISLILICVFCALTFTACSTGGGGSSGGNVGAGSTTGSGSGNNGEKDKSDKVFGNIEVPKTPSSNDFLMGAIGVYEITDDNAKIFYDKHSQTFMSYNELLERQFNSLSIILYESLNAVYGSSGASGLSINGYGSSIGYSIESLVGSDANEPNSAVNFNNAMSGGYDLVVSKVGVDYPVYSFEYTTSTISANAWKNQISSAEDIKNALKYIYVNPITKTTTSTSLDFSDNTLKSAYSNYYLESMIVENSEIDTLGFSVEYMWNTLYFLAYTIIGETNISNSIYNYNTIIVGSDPEYVYNNHASFENYKGYHLVLKSLVEKAFTATIEGLNLPLLDEDVNGISLYPKMTKTQYIYYDDINHIQDLQVANGIGDKEVDFGSGSTNFDDLTFDKGEPVAGINLRKLKKLVFIPKFSDDFKQDSFNIGRMFMGIQTNDETVLLEISWNGVASGETFEDIVAKFSDGSYEKVLFDGTKIVKERDEDSPVTKEGKLTVDNVYYSSDLNSISTSKDDLLNYNFKNASSLIEGINLDKLINNSFTQAEDNENYKYMNVYNRLFKIDLQAEEEKTTIQIGDNLIVMTMNYYSSTGSILTEIPETYLMRFSIYQPRKASS